MLDDMANGVTSMISAKINSKKVSIGCQNTNWTHLIEK